MATLVHSYCEQDVAQVLLWAATTFGDRGAFFESAGNWPVEGRPSGSWAPWSADQGDELRPSTPVGAIEDDGSGVVVTTRHGVRIHVRSGVVALPLNERKRPMETAKIWARVRGEIEPFCIFAPVGKNPTRSAEHGT
ncbi:hypothetical protein [Streptomyces yunnanensis]|uniref:Uncharacterized protein n=1 Tax=Streptomyces yunnanensis TaxID=156453 RepID=A0A9X8MZS2_9ACTN|nr:hypothetical protein [Streptomyces yunnanensis]SHM45796.1 hypothetical protein SAMN05216268_11180 [Streptomyces yunnanensis]